MQGLLQPNLKESDLWGMKKIKSMVANILSRCRISNISQVGNAIGKKMIIRIYCNILFLLTEWSFCYWNAQFYLHIEHLNKKATMPESPFLLIISCVVRKGDQDKKKGSN